MTQDWKVGDMFLYPSTLYDRTSGKWIKIILGYLLLKRLVCYWNNDGKKNLANRRCFSITWKAI